MGPLTTLCRTNLTMRQPRPQFGVSNRAADRIIDHPGPALALQKCKRDPHDRPPFECPSRMRQHPVQTFLDHPVVLRGPSWPRALAPEPPTSIGPARPTRGRKVLIALAASGGTALVQAAGTDAWTGLREAVAGWFGRGDAQRERAELERLDQTADSLQAAGPSEVERVRKRQEVVWQTRIEALLENLDTAQREQAARDFRAVLAQHFPRPGMSAGQGGLAANTVDLRADRGSIAGGVINGGVQIGNPSLPDPPQG
ncbi:hypothetical protein ACFWHL_17685 [Streptomyces massasporeus]